MYRFILDYKNDDVEEEVQFFDRTTKDFNPSLLPTELKSDLCTKFQNMCGNR